MDYEKEIEELKAAIEQQEALIKKNETAINNLQLVFSERIKDPR